MSFLRRTAQNFALSCWLLAAVALCAIGMGTLVDLGQYAIGGALLFGGLVLGSALLAYILG